MSILSKSCIYALRATMYTACQGPSGTLVSVQAMARELDIPQHYLTKVLGKLSRKRIMKSQRGKTGGMALAGPPQTITLLDIVEAVDGKAPLDGCILGPEHCSDRKPCPLRKSWMVERKRLETLFSKTRISDIIHTRGRIKL